MKLSIITPVYNRKYDIIRCIDSVNDCVIPDKKFSYEHIIIDDGSTDRTEKVVEDLLNDNMKILYNSKNMGVMNARQKGIDIASGDYILFLDSDDELVKDTFLIIQEALEDTKKKYLSYVFKTYNVKDKKSMTIMNNSYVNNSFKDILTGGALSGESSILFHKSVFDKIVFDQGTLAFEMYFVHEVARLNSQTNIPITIRLYHDSKDSLSLKLLDTKNAYRRANDYALYINEFNDDYEKFELRHKLKLLKRNAGIYYMIAGYNVTARKYFENNTIFYMLSYFGKLPFKIMLFLFKLRMRK